MLFDSRTASASRSRLPYFSITFPPAGVPAEAQEIDSALHQPYRPDYSLLDDIDEPDEHKAMSTLLGAGEPEERLKLVHQLIRPFGKSQS